MGCIVEAEGHGMTLHRRRLGHRRLVFDLTRAAGGRRFNSFQIVISVTGHYLSLRNCKIKYKKPNWIAPDPAAGDRVARRALLGGMRFFYLALLASVIGSYPKAEIRKILKTFFEFKTT